MRVEVDVPDTINFEAAIAAVERLETQARLDDDEDTWHRLTIASGVLRQVRAGVRRTPAQAKLERLAELHERDLADESDRMRDAVRDVLNVARGYRGGGRTIPIPRDVIDALRR